jgi:hypothetical protein
LDASFLIGFGVTDTVVFSLQERIKRKIRKLKNGDRSMKGTFPAK